MKSEIKVMMSDGVNKYRQLTPTDVLEKGFRDFFRKGLPTHLGHDLTLPIGWTTGLALYLGPGRAYAVGRTDYCETEEEFRKIAGVAQRFFKEQASEEFESKKEKLLKLIEKYLTGQEQLVHLETLAFHGKGFAKRVFPQIFSKIDKDGLVSLKELEPIGHGVYRMGDLCVFANQYLRRAQYLLNSLNYPFLDVLEKLKIDEKLEVKIALDEDTVGFASTYRTKIELQYWWGPKFNDNLTKIPDGVTVHVANQEQQHYTGICKTEFGWYEQDKKRVLECEEVMKRPSLAMGGHKWACRFIHSMVDPKTKIPVHIDGAIRAYTENQIKTRQEVDIKKTPRDMEYKKLWRVDGQISIPVWKGLITHYFRDNELPMEYLGVDLREEKMAFIEEEPTEEIHPLMPPIPFRSDDGIRISLSYGSKPQEKHAGVFVYAPTTLTVGEETFRAVDFQALEFIKSIKRLGLPVQIKEGIRFINHEDVIINCPVLAFDSPESIKKFNQSLRAIEKVLEKFETVHQTRLCVFNFRIEYESLCFYLSVAGASKDILQWLKSGKAELPMEEEGLSRWTADNAEWIRSNSPSATNYGIFPLLKKNGFLFIDRKMLDPKIFQFATTEAGLELRYEIPEEIRDEFHKKYEVIGSLFVDKAICQKCKASYIECGCSSYLEEDVFVAIEKIVPVGAHVTWKEFDVAETEEDQ